MDGYTVQAKINAKMEYAAAKIGKPCQVFHPTDPLAPMFQSQLTVNAQFTGNYNYNRPNEYGDPTWMVIADGSLFQCGDYLQNDEGIWFVAAKQHLLPILAVSCNRTVSVLRVGQDQAFGAIGYGGSTPATQTTIMQGWPASVLQGTKGEKNPAALPQDERMAWWSILLPHYKDFGTDIIIKTSDIIVDDLGRKYSVSSPELTDMGWRLTASLQGV